jgi:Bacteriophage Mu Gam like protein
MSKKPQRNAPLFAILTNEDGLAAAANRHVELSIALNAKKAEHDVRLAELNSEFDKQIAAEVSELNRLEAAIQLFAESRPDLFPKDAEDGPRSRTYRNAVVGFRTNPPKVEKRVPKDTFEAIVERLKMLAWGEKYVKYAEPGLDKEALLKDRAVLTDAQLAQVGLKFAQGQTFFIDPVFETADAVRKAA